MNRRSLLWILLIAGLATSTGLWALGLVLGQQRFEAGLTLAKRQMAEGRFDEARSWLAEQSARDPGNGEIPYLLGVCERADGRLDAAMAAWSSVSEDSPFAARVRLAKGKAFVRDFGRFADAEPLLKSAINGRGATAVEARHALFQLFFWQGRVD
ncbi:MAG: tetratricopeptide repeat protein, partial [Isosphaeraceae bacterium]